MTTIPAQPMRPLSAADLLFSQSEGAAGGLATLSAEANANLGGAVRNLPPMTRRKAVTQVREAAAGLLDIKLTDILIAGWSQYHDLTSAARRTLAAPGSSELVTVVTHQVTAAQQPFVNVFVDGQLLATIRLTVTVVFDVSALIAGISAGRLVAVHAGHCDISVTLAIDGVDVATGSARLELPGAIPLNPGIRLLPTNEYPAVGQPGGAGQVKPAPPARVPAAGGATSAKAGN
jgi:hypothetical protein